MRLNCLLATGVVSGAVFAFTPSAIAQQITQTIAPTSAPYDAQGFRITNFTDTSTFTFNRFDASLGTLNSVDVIFSGAIRSDIRIENEDPVARAADATVAGTFFLRRPNNTNIVLAGAIIQTQTVNLAAYDGTTDYAGVSAFNFGTITSAPDSESVTLSSSSDLALFTGAGSVITLPVVVIVGGSVNGPGNASINIASAGAPTATLRYNYTAAVAAPEPQTLGLLTGAAFPSILLVRRRRRRLLK